MDEKRIQYIFYRRNSKRHKAIIPNFYPEDWPWEADIWAVTDRGYAVEYEIKLSAHDFNIDFNKSKKSGGRILKKHDLLQGLDSSKYMPPNKFCFILPTYLHVEVPEPYGIFRVDKYGIRVERKAKMIHRRKRPIEHLVRCFRSVYYRYWDKR